MTRLAGLIGSKEDLDEEKYTEQMAMVDYLIST